jgi:hypothetical protein
MVTSADQSLNSQREHDLEMRNRSYAGPRSRDAIEFNTPGNPSSGLTCSRLNVSACIQPLFLKQRAYKPTGRTMHGPKAISGTLSTAVQSIINDVDNAIASWSQLILVAEGEILEPIDVRHLFITTHIF